MAARSSAGGGDGGGGGGESAGAGTGPRRPETSVSASGGTEPCDRPRRCLRWWARPRGRRSCTSSPCDASDRTWTARRALLPPQTPARRDSTRCESSGSVSCFSRCSCLHSSCGSHIWAECQKLLASSLTCLRLTEPVAEKQAQWDARLIHTHTFYISPPPNFEDDSRKYPKNRADVKMWTCS